MGFLRNLLGGSPHGESGLPASEPADHGPRGSYTERGDGSAGDYSKRLHGALDNPEAFHQVHKELAEESADTVKAVAKEFSAARAGSKAEGLKRVLSRHQSLMTSVAKARATGGRSAA